MGWEGVLITLAIVLVAAVFGLYFLNRWAAKKSVEREKILEQNKQSMSIYVIDKKHDHAKNIKLPKAVMDQLPRLNRMVRMYFVQAKAGPQIVTLICDKPVYDAIVPKKTLKVELAGLYIVSVQGMKTQAQLKAIRKEKKAKEKAEKKKK